MNRGRQPERFLATILFTDIVGSTDLAAEMGDAKWRQLLASHHAAVRKELKAFGGREVDTAGDGFLCSFDQPAQAVRAAEAILRDVGRLGLTLRAGIHTGECERIGGKIGGIAVHIAARVMAAAEPGEILVSSTVRDLVAGSQLDFEDAGSHELKGVPGEWHLYRLHRQQGDDTSAATPSTTDSTDKGPSNRRRVWAIAAFIGVLVLLLVVTGLALANGFGAAKPPPVAVPNSVVVLDAATGNLVDVHQVPQGPVALAYDEATKHLWIASLDAGVVTDFSIVESGPDRTTGRVGRPTDLAIGGGSVWVADSFNATVTLVDVGTGDPQKTVSNVHARQIAYGFDSAWSTDDIADRLNRLDRQSGEVAQTIDLGPGAFPTGIAVDADSIWVGNVGTSTVSRVDPVTTTVSVAGIALRQVPDAMAAGSSGVWIASRESDATLRVDTATNSVSQTIAVADQPVAIGVDGETVWVGCAGPREVWHLALDGTVLSKTFAAGVPTDIVIVDGRVYVTVTAS